MSIVISNITKKYGDQKALDNVSFSIDKGEVVGILGPNGAGKSTLMKIITCFLPPTSGKVNVHGFDIFDDSLKIREILGYLPEHNPLYDHMYIEEYLSFMAGIFNIKHKKDRITEIMELTGLLPERTKKIEALSKGYRQRVGLAQALIHDPTVLILDEPTSGLDPNQIVEIRNLIKMIGKEKTVLLSTHIMQEVEAMCSRVVIIDKGHLVADDKTENLINNTLSNQVLIAEFNQPIDTKIFLETDYVSKIRNTKGNTYEIEINPGLDARENIFKTAVENNLSILSLFTKTQSLEEVFQRLTK